MEYVRDISDISKETLTFLAFFDNKIIEKIPSRVITKLCEEAADSNADFYIDTNKSFAEQQISEEAKDLISLIYYDYIAEKDEKEEILKQWNLNEKKYQEKQNEKYEYENLFHREKTTTECTQLVEVKKETLFEKIKKILKQIIKR